jgi:hypothetical protein
VGAGAVAGRCFFRGGVSGGEFSKNEQMFVKIKTEHHTEFTKLIFKKTPRVKGGACV